MLDKLYARYRDRVDFYAVYIREAHPTDGWKQAWNERLGVSVAQPKTAEARHLVASKWMHEIYEPIMAMIPPDATGKLEPAEIYHEILEHRWYLSEQAGQQVDIFDTARDYIDRFLTAKPDEAITGDEAVTEPE